MRQPKYSDEEFERRGTEICESSIRSEIETGNIGKIVAIDIESGAYAIAGGMVTISALPNDTLPASTGIFR